ncbi:MAG: endonuclease/exonuclease/phosphatase family protein [Oscillospiraceae bacterium]|nr:endonuclease/exonuclease/phosphatase family protein [Oscillospiraceae bacterium]
MKIMTYNICSCHNMAREYDPDAAMKIIAAENPDILGINEMDYMNERGFFTDMPKIFAETLGFTYYYFGKTIDFRGGGYGNVIYSKFPIKNVTNYPIPETSGAENRVVICAELENGLTVLVTHYGLSVEERNKAVAETVRLAENKKPLIFMGDLNCTPYSDELKPIHAILKDTPNGPSFPSDKPDVKIDYIFVSEDINVETSYLIHTQASDHLPYVAILNF